MLEVTHNLPALQDHLAKVAKEVPLVAQDAMDHGMFFVRKSWLSDLEPRMPGLVRNPRTSSGGIPGGRGWIWWVTSYIDSRGQVVGRFRPRKYTSNLALLESGGTVTAQGRYLAIPLRRRQSGKVPAGYRTPRSHRASKGPLVSMRRGGQVFLHGVTPKGKARKKPEFLLTRSIHIQPQLGLFSFWGRPEIRSGFMERVRKDLTKPLKAVLEGRKKMTAKFNKKKGARP